MSRGFRYGAVLMGLALLVVPGCGKKQDTAPMVATAQLTLSRPKIALGSPVEVTYRFTVAPNAPSLGVRRVFVHFLDADEELMWTDDHDPPTPTTQWKPGQTIEYTRTMFVPSYPYVGAAKVATGLYTPGSNDRLRLSIPDRGDRSYTVATFELLPQTENIFLIFKDGWHPAEVVAEGASRTEWQWTKKEATIAFRNPKRDVVLFLQVDTAASAGAAQLLTVQLGDQPLTTVPLSSREAPVRKFPISAAQLGPGEMVELRLTSDRTFVPALESSGSRNTDPRELGVRVFHAFVQ